MLFLQQERDGISIAGDGRFPLIFVNNETINQMGVELQVTGAPINELLLSASYRGVRSRGATTGDRYQRMPEHVFNFTADASLPRDIELHLDAQVVAGFAIPSVDVSGGALIIASDSPVPNQYVLNVGLQKNLPTLPGFQFFFSARDLLGLFRPHSDLSQASAPPFSTPIGVTFLLGLRYHPRDADAAE